MTARTHRRSYTLQHRNADHRATRAACVGVFAPAPTPAAFRITI